MNHAQVEQIVNAVLYEGYMLYPYRPSSVKNRQRWTFGGVYPQAYAQGQGGADAWTNQTECLAAGSDQTAIEISVRFLHLLNRTVGELIVPVAELPAEPTFRAVATLQVGEQRYQTWQEAVEREIEVAPLSLDMIARTPHRLAFGFPAQRTIEPVRAAGGLVVGVIAREQQAIAGAVEVAAAQVADQLWKITVRVENCSALEQAQPLDRDAALMRSFVSAHTILAVQDGEFISLTDPPESARDAVAACRNVGVWPVLVGTEGEHTMLLASPIILYDYPQVAPESPGNLFDGTEIDEILTLRIMTMTEQEKREMGTVDERTRALLERTEALARDELMRLHGTVRSMRPVEE